MGATASGLRTPFDTWPESLRRTSGGLGLRKGDNDIAVCPSVSLLSSRDFRGTQADLSASQPDASSNYLCQTSWPQTRRCMCDTSNWKNFAGILCLLEIKSLVKMILGRFLDASKIVSNISAIATPSLHPLRNCTITTPLIHLKSYPNFRDSDARITSKMISGTPR